MTDTLSLADRTYSWNSQWAKVPDGVNLGYTHGVAVDREGLVHVFNQSAHALLTFDADGNFVRMWDAFPSDRFLGAHGLTLVQSDGEEFLWLTDQTSGEVVKTTLTGETVLSIDKPEHQAYAEGGNYSPTWASESPTNGDVYVADGYGSWLVHHYDKSGQYLDTLDGSSGAGAFKCPHAVWIGTRTAATGTDDPVLYVTDRGNSRVQVFGLDGSFIKAFDQQHPCCFDQHADGTLLVPDLHGFINLYDGRDELVAEHIGDNREIVGKHGWPNVPDEMRVAGRFNSPHGGCFDGEGNIYIVEWVADGRITKLTREG
ncbi:hypothetical protein ACERK3_18915 [Phycisphaerales bacterium AB-hyl4]|uniref:NHL repeat-containing protein n=1 Tax=Natronomicrosphaera hydrolytica TaxID=3242702 RepID=A0ABV4U9R0_9BACT